MYELEMLEQPCPNCGGILEYYSFSADCGGSPGSSGIQCQKCKKEFTGKDLEGEIKEQERKNNKPLMKAKQVIHHDVPPCNERLTSSNVCPKCGYLSNMGNLVLYSYCQYCDVRLKDLKCPKCNQTFAKPF